MRSLQHFVDAQEGAWLEARQELDAGRKESHWIWFVFPQLGALGTSVRAAQFGLDGPDDAHAYLAHPVLGPRLRAGVELLLQHAGERSAAQILGDGDALKLQACLTLFDAAAPQEPLFHMALDLFFGGARHAATVSLVAST